VTLRDYQERALSGVFEAFGQSRAVCLIAPTGAGKTVMGSEAVARAACRTVWLTHRGELIDQSAAALERAGQRVGVFAAGRMENTDAPVVVASWQTLLGRDEVPPADLLVVDECHHAKGTEWQKVLERYASARLLGLTATPQRGDGRSLGDVFERLVVAAQYSELITAGHLVPCRVFRPDQDMSPDLAQHPVDAYKRHAPGKSCIVFARSVELAKQYAAEFTEAGHAAEAIEANTPASVRADIIDRFKRGETRVLVNVFVLTEGFDAPATEVCIIARGCSYTATFLQMVGRVLRPAPGKTAAILIDLAGVSHSHGLPTEDRTYSLDGKQAISSTGALRVCPACGLCYAPTGDRACPGCGHVTEAGESGVRMPRIYDAELLEVFAGADTPESYQLREWERLVSLCNRKQWSLDWAAKQFRKLFSRGPDPSWFTEEQKRATLVAFRAFGAQRGFKPGFAAVRYKELFGSYPPRGV
jgi:DNA repair protein RadD